MHSSTMTRRRFGRREPRRVAEERGLHEEVGERCRVSRGALRHAGELEYNLALGSRRAGAVKDYMVGLVVPANRVTVLSKGKEQPFCTEESKRAGSRTGEDTSSSRLSRGRKGRKGRKAGRGACPATPAYSPIPVRPLKIFVQLVLRRDISPPFPSISSTGISRPNRVSSAGSVVISTTSMARKEPIARHALRPPSCRHRGDTRAGGSTA